MKHLLIDFENLQPDNLDKVPAEHTHIWLFVGAVQKTLTVELVQSLLRFGERAHIVRVKKTGKNALDFYLSYYLGKITEADPEAAIIIVSKDGGYDLLLEHITDERQARGIVRLAAVDEVCLDAAPAPPPVTVLSETPAQVHRPLAPYYQAALSALRRPDAFRPSRAHNLSSMLKHRVLSEQLADKDEIERETIVRAIIRKLVQQKLIETDETQEILTYHLSDHDILQKIRNYVLQIKPQTAAEFQAAVRGRAQDFALTVGGNDIAAFTKHLEQQGLLRQTQDAIQYPPFLQENHVPPQQTAREEAVNLDQQKLLAIIRVKNRPAKRAKLHNAVKATLKCDDARADNLIAMLQKQKYLTFDNETVIYKKT